MKNYIEENVPVINNSLVISYHRLRNKNKNRLEYIICSKD